MKLISWNLASRTKRLAQQLAARDERRPDVVALQEITLAAAMQLRVSLPALGLTHVLDTLEHAAAGRAFTGPRRTGRLTASRFPIELRTVEPPIMPWPERMLSVAAGIGNSSVEIHNVHVPPGSSNGWIKIDILKRRV